MGEIFRELQREAQARGERKAFERWMHERGTPLELEQTQAFDAFKAGIAFGIATAGVSACHRCLGSRWIGAGQIGRPCPVCADGVDVHGEGRDA